MSDADALLKLAEAVADDRLDELDAPDGAVTPFAALQRIARAFRNAGTQERQEQESYDFKWRHLLVKEQIGQGGFGTVYRAYDPILRRDVALKLSRRLQPASEAAIVAEARLMARLRHPNILAVHGADTDGEAAGIWSDLLSGETLAGILERHPRWTVAELLAVAAPVASALETIHASGLTHGDIKPANIMITPNGAPVLMDFGAGRKLSRSGSPGAGSPLLMAPEQFDTLDSSPESDVYAFGAMLYRASGGRYPVEASTLEALEELHAAGTSPDWSLPDRRVRPLLKRMLHRLPQARPSASAVRDELAKLVSAPQRRRRRIAVAVVIASLALGLLLSADGTRRAQDAERQALAEKAASQASLDFLKQLLLAPSGVHQGANVRMVDALELARSRLRADPPESAFVRAKVEQTLALTLQNLDQYDAARELLESAFAFYRDSPGECCEDRAETLIALANNSLSRGDQADALARLDLAATALRQSTTDLPVLRVSLLKARAEATFAAGDFQESARLLREALAMDGAPAGLSGELRADLQAELAAALLRTSDLDAAEATARQSLEWIEANLGREDFRTAKPRHVASTVMLLRGDFVEAERMARANLAILQASEPEISSDRLAVMVNILDVLNETDRFDEALPLAIELHALSRRLHGPMHGRTLQSRGNIGVTLSALGRYDEAAAVFRENWQDQRKAFGETALDTLVSRGNLAEALLFAGRLREAEAIGTASHAANVGALGADHLATLYFDAVLALTKSRLGKTAEAVSALEANLDAKRRTLGEDNRMTWDTRGYLVEALLADGQAERALPLAEKLVAYRVAQHGETHRKSVDARAQLAKARRAAKPRT